MNGLAEIYREFLLNNVRKSKCHMEKNTVVIGLTYEIDGVAWHRNIRINPYIISRSAIEMGERQSG